MAKKLAIVIHRETNIAVCIKSKTDLALFLEVSLSTVIRKYNDIGMYQSGIYTIYVGVEYYQSDKEKNYKHDAIPPVINKSIDEPRQQIANNIVIMTNNDQVVIQPIEEKLDDDTLAMSQYKEFYSTKTYEELTMYKNKHINKPYRLKWIDYFGKILKDNQGY